MEEQLFPAPPAVQGPTGPTVAPGPTITSIATRLKLAEERYTNLLKRNQLTEESLLSFEKDIKTELRVLTKQTVELRKQLAEINAKVDTMVGELNNAVKKHEFNTAQTYLDLWQPMQFVTRDEAKRLIAERKNNLEDPNA